MEAEEEQRQEVAQQLQQQQQQSPEQEAISAPAVSSGWQVAPAPTAGISDAASLEIPGSMAQAAPLAMSQLQQTQPQPPQQQQQQQQLLHHQLMQQQLQLQQQYQLHVQQQQQQHQHQQAQAQAQALSSMAGIATGVPPVAAGGAAGSFEPHPHLARLQKFWEEQMLDCRTSTAFKNHQLPLARIKRIMKSDEDVKMISAEAPVLFAKACEMFILELTLRSWIHTDASKRRTLQRSDLAHAVNRTDIFDFLCDIVPREDGPPVPGQGAPQSAAAAAAAAAVAAAPSTGVPSEQVSYFYNFQRQMAQMGQADAAQQLLMQQQIAASAANLANGASAAGGGAGGATPTVGITATTSVSNATGANPAGNAASGINTDLDLSASGAVIHQSTDQ